MGLGADLFFSNSALLWLRDIMAGSTSGLASLGSPSKNSLFSRMERRDAVSVNILDMEKDYAAAQQPMWISVGDKTFSWDGTRLGNVAVTIQDADNAEVTGMLKALGTTTTVEIGTSEQPPAQFPSPADNKAKAIFDICTDLL